MITKRFIRKEADSNCVNPESVWQEDDRYDYALTGLFRTLY